MSNFGLPERHDIGAPEPNALAKAQTQVARQALNEFFPNDSDKPSESVNKRLEELFWLIRSLVQRLQEQKVLNGGDASMKFIVQHTEASLAKELLGLSSEPDEKSLEAYSHLKRTFDHDSIKKAVSLIFTNAYLSHSINRDFEGELELASPDQEQAAIEEQLSSLEPARRAKIQEAAEVGAIYRQAKEKIDGEPNEYERRELTDLLRDYDRLTSELTTEEEALVELAIPVRMRQLAAQRAGARAVASSGFVADKGTKDLLDNMSQTIDNQKTTDEEGKE